MNALEILEYYEGRQESILSAIREIVDIESPSRDAEGSRAVADWIDDKVRETGADVSIERETVEDGTHIIIHAFSNEGPSAMLLGHTDTVHPRGSADRNPTRIEDGRLYGCGIFDMKANIVLMIEALRYFAQSGSRPARPVTIVLSCDEEIGSFTGRKIVEREASKAAECLVFEPSSDGRVKTGRKGTGMFILRARGVPAHAGLDPEKGANAVAELARQVDRVHSIARPEEGTTVNVTTFNGGTTLNVIPEHAECEIDVRFAHASEAERVTAALGSLEPVDQRVSLALAGAVNRMPLERNDAVVELFEKARSLAASFGYELGETQVGGGSDGNFVAALGVPVLDGLGITGDGAHTLHEHILLSDIAKRATLVTLLLSSG